MRQAASELGSNLNLAKMAVKNQNATVTPTAIAADGRYAYAVTASDADGDTLTYKLESASPGMTVDKATGRIEWTITAQTKGAHRVKIVVEDGHGGHAHQEFDLSL